MNNEKLVIIRRPRLQEEIKIKKSTLKKIAAIIVIVCISLTSGYLIFQNVIIPRSILTERISDLKNEVTNKKSEIEQLDSRISNLQSQINNLTQIIAPKSDNITQLGTELNALNVELAEANKEITNLVNELSEAQRYIRILEEGIANGPVVIVK